MKDETAGVAAEEIVGLKAKVYSFLVDDSKKNKKAKGVNKNVVATKVIMSTNMFCSIKNV